MQIKINSCPVADDFFKFSLNHAKKRLIIVPAVALGVISLFYLAIFIYLGPDYWTFELTTYYIGFFVFAVVVLPLLNIALIKITSSRQFHTSVHPESDITISDEGLQSHSVRGDSRVPWSYIYRVAESKSAVYFYLSSAQAVILPARSFTPEQYAQLHELSRKYIPPKKNKLKY